MREFTKSFFSFSWAMSLFGAGQLAKIVVPPSQGQQAHPATAAFNAVAEAASNQLGDSIGATFKVGDNMQRGTVDMLFNVLSPGATGTAHVTSATTSQPPISDPREEVIIRYTVGTGEFSRDMKYNVLRMKMYKPSGESDGTHDGVWEPQLLPDDLYKRPNPPEGPVDRPEGPVEHIPIRAFTKAIWTFGDGSSITAVGPANLHLVRLVDDAQLFLVSVAAIITNGTGRYEGAYGVKTALGSTLVPKGADLFNLPPGFKFGAVTVETFRVIKAREVKPVRSAGWTVMK